MKKNIIAAIFCLISHNAMAELQIFITPPSWVVNTNTSKNIENYLSDIKYHQWFIQDDVKSDEMKKATNLYRELLKEKILLSSNGLNSDENRIICKLSIATGKTSLQDKSPPEIIALEGEADNKSEFFAKFSKELQILLDKDISLIYPNTLKETGSYAISMIFVFDKDKK